jgi:hypothetical protein
MDFQRLFKRKQEGPASPFTKDGGGDAFNDRDVVIREGELFDGTSPVRLDWSRVNGAITVKAGNILGVFEGRTRIKAGALEEAHPGKFAELPDSEVEFNIPLHVVVMQIQDIFCSPPRADAKLDSLETPFAELAREDEVRFNKGHWNQPIANEIVDPKSSDVAALTEAAPKKGGKGDTPGIRVLDSRHLGPVADTESHLPRAEEPRPVIGGLGSAPDSDGAPSRISSPQLGIRSGRSPTPLREGYERLQELYLTDEPLDGTRISELILQLPRVTGALIVLSDGSVLGGKLGGEISDQLLNSARDFATQVSRFTEILPEGPTRFITFFAHALQMSLVIGGDVLMLIGHEGKNLPPGLRERLVATAEALNTMYGS